MVTKIPLENPHKELEGNPKYWGDSKVCCVVSFMEFLDISYEESYCLCKSIGSRVEGKGMGLGGILRVMEHLVESTSSSIIKLPHGEGNRITINSFIKQYGIGIYFCLHRGHSFVIKDGVLFDYYRKPKRQIIHAWKLQ